MLIKILMDLDGCLAHFIAAALAAHDRPWPYDQPGCAGRWDIETILEIAPQVFWAPLGRSFWANLPWLADGRDLLNTVEALAGGPESVCLLSSPCETDGCLEGKRDWIRAHLPGYRRRYLLGPAKDFAAGAGRLLVDDSEVNVDAFQAAGGRAVLVPRPWNHLHAIHQAGKTVDYVRQTLSLEIAGLLRRQQPPRA